jgi:3-hydroxyacyl-CoA dehydrogenase
MSLSVFNIQGRPVAILGGGVLGRRIACMWAAGGWDVNIRDPSAEQRLAALHYVENNINEYHKITGISKVAGTVQTFEKLEDAVRNAWTVIEAVPEKLQLKIDTFAELEKATKLGCLLCSNSSSYKSGEMLVKVKPETRKRIFNTHYMMPPRARVVELMTDGQTNPEIFPFYAERLKEVGFLPIVARKESTGFVFNRLWAAIKRECLTILSEGVSSPEELDAVWVEMYSGNKMGPCGMMDAVGLDTVAFIEEHYIQERGLSSVATVDYLKREFLSKGKLGAKSGAGGLYPPGQTTKTSSEAQGDHSNLHAPTL